MAHPTPAALSPSSKPSTASSASNSKSNAAPAPSWSSTTSKKSQPKISPLHISNCRSLVRVESEREKPMEIKSPGSQPSVKGPAEWFTGNVRIDPLFHAPDPARVGGATVTFEPGARTAWHTHPLGQTLIITAGSGWVQREGGPKQEIHPGDVIWFAPG